MPRNGAGEDIGSADVSRNMLLPEEQSIMKSIYALTLLFFLQPVTLHHAQAEQNRPVVAAQSVRAAPGPDAEAFGLTFVNAIETASDCAAMTTNLDALFAYPPAAVASLTTQPRSGAEDLSEEIQQRLLAAAQKVRRCAGKVKSSKLEAVRSALANHVTKVHGRKLWSVGEAKLVDKLRGKSAAAAAPVDCQSNCCVKGWETWAAEAFFSAGCLAGDNQACCLVTELASYNACVKTYCPSNNCCLDVNPGPLPEPPGG